MPISSSDFASGEYVKVELDVEVFRLMQQGHGGWNETMAKVQFHEHLPIAYTAKLIGDI